MNATFEHELNHLLHHASASPFPQAEAEACAHLEHARQTTAQEDIQAYMRQQQASMHAEHELQQAEHHEVPPLTDIPSMSTANEPPQADTQAAAAAEQTAASIHSGGTSRSRSDRGHEVRTTFIVQDAPTEPRYNS